MELMLLTHVDGNENIKRAAVIMTYEGIHWITPVRLYDGVVCLIVVIIWMTTELVGDCHWHYLDASIQLPQL